jgi:hypothetical protein
MLHTSGATLGNDYWQRTEYSEKNLSRCYFLLYLDCPEIEQGPLHCKLSELRQLMCVSIYLKRPTLVQAVNCRALTAEARVPTWITPCGNCGGQSGTEIGFSSSSSVFPCQYHSTAATHAHISSRG